MTELGDELNDALNERFHGHVVWQPRLFRKKKPWKWTVYDRELPNGYQVIGEGRVVEQEDGIKLAGQTIIAEFLKEPPQRPEDYHQGGGYVVADAAQLDREKRYGEGDTW